ncbi:MAG: hypothetical protein QW751_00760 [Candidatus Aenigmatarchaeota archaeon]|nr:hypothetical protein [Candidatus Aenigmarchaeota archaeon]
MKNPHFRVVREIGSSGLVEAVNIAGDRWLAWDRPTDSTGTPTYVCINRGLSMKRAQLPDIVAKLFSEKSAKELSRELGILVTDKKYAA